MKHQELIDKIKKDGHDGGKEMGTAMALVPFAELLCKLAKDADVIADKNIKLQKALTRFTIALLILGAIQLLVMLLPFFTQIG